MMIKIEGTRWKCHECGKFRAENSIFAARSSAHKHVENHPKTNGVAKPTVHKLFVTKDKEIKSPIEIKPCSLFPTKKQHKTIEEGKQHIKELYARGLGNPDYHVYKCKQGCGMYHVGHNKKHLNNRIKVALRSKK